MRERGKRPADPLRHNRDFQLLWGGQAASEFGSRMSALAYPLVVIAETGSASKAGIVMFAFTGPLVGFQLVAGTAVDRLSRKPLLIACDAGRFTVLGSVALMFALGHFVLGIVITAAFIEGGLTALFDLAELSVLPSLVTKDQLPLAVSRNQARSQSASLLAPPTAGFLLSLSHALPFATDAATYLVSLLSVKSIRSDMEHRTARVTTPFWADTREGMQWLWRHAFLRACAFVGAGTNLVFASLTLILIVRAGDLGASKTVIGMVLAAGGAGGIVGALVAPSLQARFRAHYVVLGLLWYWAGVTVLLILVDKPFLLGLLYALIVATLPILNVVLVSLRVAYSPAAVQGRVHAASRLLGGTGMVVGPVIAGFTLEELGSHQTLVVLASSIALLAGAATAAPALRHGTSDSGSTIPSPAGDG